MGLEFIGEAQMKDKDKDLQIIDILSCATNYVGEELRQGSTCFLS
jgi:hypothetical protein